LPKKIATVAPQPSSHALPPWVSEQQDLIADLSAAVEEFVARYVRTDGTLIWRDEWPGMDGSDDPYEGFQYFPLFYALTGNERIYELGRKIWDGITWQWTEYGQIHREFDGYYDWMHHGEANLFHYFFGLTKPDSLQDRARAVRFAKMYTGDDSEAPNFDKDLGIIRAPMSGSRGPRFETTHEDWMTHRGVLDSYHAPFEDMSTSPFDLGTCNWSRDDVYEEVVRLMNERMTRGDVPLNMNASGQMTHAFMYTHDSMYTDWVLKYLTAWRNRALENNGIIPDNVGLSGKVGEYLDGKWWGGHYGWRWPHGLITIIEPIVNIVSNALLMTGDESVLALAREQIDVNYEMGQEIEGVWHTPNKHFDAGWTDFRPANPYHAIHLWFRSLAGEDHDRVERCRGALDWSKVSIAEKPFSVKHYNTNTLPWYEFINSNLPSYPTDVLAANRRLLAQQLDRLRSDHGNPRAWDSIEQINDYPESLSMQVDGYAIHAWQEFNPLYFESLVHLQWGAPMHISHGGFQFASLRYFNPIKSTPGLPAGVSALVSAVTAEHVTVTLGNLGSEEAQCIIQAGAFAEHTFTKIREMADEEVVETTDVDSPWCQIIVPAQSTVTLRCEMSRHSRTPSYENPFSALDNWDPLIKPRKITE
jgi:hypothetical protein